MKKFEILCVTMGQTDFSKISEMNVHSNIVFANQAGEVSYSDFEFEGHLARMVTTNTRGVGKNRNIGLIYANADICLFADDDVTYVDNLEDIVLSEFELCPKADIIVFNLNTDSKERKQISYTKTRKHGKFERMPWGAVRIAFRLKSVKKANLWFSTLFGGGCVFPSGEDSMWLLEAKRKGLTFYVSKETIGSVSFDTSTWFTGYDEKFFYGKGAYCGANHKVGTKLWELYYAWRFRKEGDLSMKEKLKWIGYGEQGYKLLYSYEKFSKEQAVGKNIK